MILLFYLIHEIDFTDSLRYTSALSIGLAGVFLVVVAGISIVKIINGDTMIPRLFPIITDAASVFELFTTFPVLLSAYICHTVGMKYFQVS